MRRPIYRIPCFEIEILQEISKVHLKCICVNVSQCGKSKKDMFLRFLREIDFSKSKIVN